MKRIMISQPMANKSEIEINKTRDLFLDFAKKHKYDVVNTLFTDDWYSDKSMIARGVRNIPLCFIAKSLEMMSLCDGAIVKFTAIGTGEAYIISKVGGFGYDKAKINYLG